MNPTMSDPPDLREEGTPGEDERTQRHVRRTILHFVLPAYLIAGAGVFGALYVNWHQQTTDEYHRCVATAETRVNFRQFALGQQAQIDQFLDLGKPDSPNIVKARQIAASTRHQIDVDFPVLPYGRCHKPWP